MYGLISFEKECVLNNDTLTKVSFYLPVNQIQKLISISGTRIDLPTRESQTLDRVKKMLGWLTYTENHTRDVVGNDGLKCLTHYP